MTVLGQDLAAYVYLFLGSQGICGLALMAPAQGITVSATEFGTASLRGAFEDFEATLDPLVRAPWLHSPPISFTPRPQVKSQARALHGDQWYYRCRQCVVRGTATPALSTVRCCRDTPCSSTCTQINGAQGIRV